ncbi:hypothetical protein KC315_g3 [Hortaea werneckii]|nr:hypothetical protein KC315_g3 [Hortaea werneckii]
MGFAAITGEELWQRWKTDQFCSSPLFFTCGETEGVFYIVSRLYDGIVVILLFFLLFLLPFLDRRGRSRLIGRPHHDLEVAALCLYRLGDRCWWLLQWFMYALE